MEGEEKASCLYKLNNDETWGEKEKKHYRMLDIFKLHQYWSIIYKNCKR